MSENLGGRPTIYSEDLAINICARLAAGEPLVKMCRDESMPGVTSVYRWLASNEVFREMYTRAREDQADTLADEIITIADESQMGTKTTTRTNGVTDTVTGDMVERSKLRVDARKWIASKLKPKKYGEFMRQEHSGTDGKPMEIKIVDYATVQIPAKTIPASASSSAR